MDSRDVVPSRETSRANEGSSCRDGGMKQAETCRSERLPIYVPSPVISQHAKARFDTPLVAISELTSTPTALSEAYIRLSTLLPTPATNTFSPVELRIEDYFDLFRTVLSDLMPIWSPQEAIFSVLEAVKLLVDQLEDCWKSGNEAERRCALLQTTELDLKHQLEMAQTSCKLLFDKVQLLDKAQDTSPMGIEGEIARKEAEVVRLQQEIRRLTSRKVIRDISDTQTDVAMQLRSVRSMRSRSGSITPSRKHSLSPLLLASPTKDAYHRPTPHRDLYKDLQGKLSQTGTLDTSVDMELSVVRQSSYSIWPVKMMKMKPERGDCCPAF